MVGYCKLFNRADNSLKVSIYSAIAIETRYELVAGRIIEMPPESPENINMAIYLLLLIAKEVDRKSNTR